MSRLSALADGNLIGQTVELINGKDTILNGSYVKADGRLLDKATYPELYSMKGDAIDDPSFYTITTQVGTSSTESVDSLSGVYMYPPATVTLDGKFITVGTRNSNGNMISVSYSDDGESWSFPSYINTLEQFVGVRVFSTGVFIVTNGGIYRSTDYGKNFTKVYSQSNLRDIAFNGISTYVVTSSTATVYTGDVTTGIMTQVSHGGSAAISSVVWSGTSFVVCSYNVTTVRVSSNGLTWTAGGSLIGTYITDYGNRLYNINGNIVAFCNSSSLFNYSSNNATSWTASVPIADSTVSNIIYNNGLYYTLSSTSISVYTSLNATPTSYTIPALNAANKAEISHNGVNFLYEVKYITGGKGYTYVSSTAPTGNITDASKLLGHIFSSSTIFGGGNTLLTTINISGTIILLGAYKYNNSGLFVPVKYSASQYYFATGTEENGIYHYAKDAKILYYTKVVAANSIALYAISLDLTTNVFGTEILLGNIGAYSGVIYVFRHTNGLFISGSTSHTSVFDSSIYINYTEAIGNSVFVSHDGMTILLGSSAAPYSTYYSANGGKSFVSFIATLYSSSGAVITSTVNTAKLYKLGEKFYSGNGSVEGDTPYVLNYKAGVPAVSHSCLRQITDKIIISNDIGKIELMGSNIVVSNIATATSVESIFLEDGSIVINGSQLKFYTANNIDSTKFRISKLSPSMPGKAVYIKAK